ncbi:MAG: hypothetical protein WCF95_07565 [bacterium]|jgi:hypothetical protein
MNRLFATQFASLGFIIVLGKLFYSLWPTGEINPIYVLEMSLFAAVVFGIIGYFLGKVFDLSKKSEFEEDVFGNKKDAELLIDDVLIYDIGIKNRKEEEKKEEPTNE